MNYFRHSIIAALLAAPALGGPVLTVRSAGEHSVRITLSPDGAAPPFSPGVAVRDYPAPAIAVSSPTRRMTKRIGALEVEVRPSPLTVTVWNMARQKIQSLTFEPDGRLTFDLDGQPVLGLGEGGPKPADGVNWRELPIQFDRNGALDTMEPRWQSDAYGSRNPVATLVGTAGWALYMPTPWGQIDLTNKSRGALIPRVPTAADLTPPKGMPPAKAYVPGEYDVFVIDAHDPADFVRAYSRITGPAALPPKWALGYMQSHRTLEDDTQMTGIVDTFRAKQIPVDAVIYLGTGFTPRGWNTPQPSFDFNPEVFKHDPAKVLAALHDRHVKVVLHMVPWDRDKLPVLDDAHATAYWKEHEPLVRAGVDAFWPDEGDGFDLFERVRRHQMYYEGSLATTPNVRPWSLHRNGYPGIAQWGGWVWSGDTESSWKTLEAQIAVGINFSLSISPYWGSDIGGFFPTPELTGELYARWFEFASFVPSFRAHGRTWQMRLPWGWGLKDRGPLENNTNILESELNNPAIEPIAKKYDELHYRLLPYEYTLAYEARTTGMPLMRAMWLEFPHDPAVRGLGGQYMWGPNLLVAPVFEKGATQRAVYLPAGTWYDWWMHEAQAGGRTVKRVVDLATLPIYVRAGAIVPVDPVRQYTSQPVLGFTTLEVYRGANGTFTLYDDDGVSQQYQRNEGSWIRLTWNDAAKTLTVEPGTPAGIGATNVINPKVFMVRMLPEGTERTLKYQGKKLTASF